jgi:hypothetical protein
MLAEKKTPANAWDANSAVRIRIQRVAIERFIFVSPCDLDVETRASSQRSAGPVLN